MNKKILYIRQCRPAAEEAGKVFNMNPRVILAQGALESGWGTSLLAVEHHNFFGIMGYGTANAYWHGERAVLENARGIEFHFRHYSSLRMSFLDFARLIHTGYHRAWSFSRQPEVYAKEIAYSPYISELNHDNREVYRRNIVLLEEEIGRIIDWGEDMEVAA
ncbi:glucosaminidase domain-containing protein [Parabacteroides sp. AM08-6]|uniref:glucosaminidase domain-containing protein n=1 Tax=Parabacteroides sp. AM08-6 TaxID=2292053 RepID=UPI000EFE5931|nr:glucosaminidase domain-containing protein [Parabacteroides sp. AM08-6]RHJ84902.1 glucosaminidase [Parabacteroides sp. AM08-6]